MAAIAIKEEIEAKRKKTQEPSGPPRHDHDCLVNQCRFHQDAEVDKLMVELLARNKLRRAVIMDHDIKSAALSLIIAEIRERRPLAGDGTDFLES